MNNKFIQGEIVYNVSHGGSLYQVIQPPNSLNNHGVVENGYLVVLRSNGFVQNIGIGHDGKKDGYYWRDATFYESIKYQVARFFSLLSFYLKRRAEKRQGVVQNTVS